METLGAGLGQAGRSRARGPDLRRETPRPVPPREIRSALWAVGEVKWKYVVFLGKMVIQEALHGHAIHFHDYFRCVEYIMHKYPDHE